MSVKKWAAAEDDIIRRYYQAEGPIKILERLPCRTASGVKNRASRLGIRYQHWTEDEDRVLRMLYPTYGTAYCRRHLPHRSLQAIQSRALRLDITCNRETLLKHQHANGDYLKALKIIQGPWTRPRVYRGNWT